MATAERVRVQRCCGTGECKKKKPRPMLKAAGTKAAKPRRDTEQVREIDLTPGIGRPLDAGTRGFMESRFGHDFGAVRVHTDARSAQAATELGALAYTVGNDVHFATGRYQPDTRDGRMLLATS